MLEADNLHHMLQGIILVRKTAIRIPEFGFRVQKSNMTAAAIWNFKFVARIAKFDVFSSEFEFP